MDPEPGNEREPGNRPRAGLALNWESAAKVGAGLLLAVALITSLPALMHSDKPPPLEPDVGLPQMPAPAAPTPGPDRVQAGGKTRAKARAKAKARRIAVRRAARERRVAGRRPRRRSRKGDLPGEAPAPPAPPPAAPPVPLAATLPPAPSHEDFGFEGP